MPKYGVFSGPYFPVFWLNTEIVNLRIHSVFSPNTGQLWTRKNSLFGHFSRSDVSWEEYIKLKTYTDAEKN